MIDNLVMSNILKRTVYELGSKDYIDEIRKKAKENEILIDKEKEGSEKYVGLVEIGTGISLKLLQAKNYSKFVGSSLNTTFKMISDNLRHFKMLK